MKWRGRKAIFFFSTLLAGVLLIAGCPSLCGQRLYLHRDTPEKIQPSSALALLITDPGLAQALVPVPDRYLKDRCPWAEEKLAHESDSYRLYIEKLDDRSVFQGLCSDTYPTYVCEVRPGNRKVMARFDLYGTWGHEKVVKEMTLNLEPGKCYFLRPDCEEMANKRFTLKIDVLPQAYTTELRGRLLDRQRKTLGSRYVAD